MVFHWSLSNSESHKASRTFLSILADLYNSVIRIVSTRPFISMTSSPCTNPWVTIPKAPITVSITVTFLFQSFFFSSLARSMSLSLFSLYFNLILGSAKIISSSSSSTSSSSSCNISKHTNMMEIFLFYLTSCKFFCLSLTDGLSMDSKWQQIFPGLLYYLIQLI